MYLKLSAINEEFQLQFLNKVGDVLDITDPIEIKLYNKVGKIFQLIKTENTPEFEYDNSTLTDKESVYVDVSLNNVVLKTKIKVSVVTTEVRLRYKLTYETTYPFRKISTTFLRRVSLGMPAWSTSFKNDISTFSKVFYPLYVIPERLYYKTKEALHNNLQNKTFVRPITTRETIAIVKREDGTVVPRTFIREKEMINDVSTEKINQKNIKLVSFSVDESVTYPVYLDNTFSKLFIRSDKSCILIIKGINKRRIPISEQIYCDGVLYTRSFLDYKAIYSIEVVKITGYEEPNLEATNYLNLRKYQTNFRANMMTGLPDDNKEFDIPLYNFMPETNSIKTYFAKQWLQESDGSIEYYVPHLEGHNGFFVTEDEDVIAISPRVSLGTEESHDGLLTEIDQKIFTETKLYKIYTGQLRTDLETDLVLHSSNNNNSIVTILDENSASNDGEVDVQILIKDIVENYGNVSVRISVNIDGIIYYLNDQNDWVEEPVYKLLNNNNPIYVSQNVQDCTYFSVVLEFNNISYQASYVKNRVDMVPHDVYVREAYHNGTDLIVKKDDNEYYKLVLEKDYYEFRNDNEIYYDNITNDTTLINERGYKDGEYSV